MQTDIAKYALWLFHESGAQSEQLPALYDHLCRKNPVRSDLFSFKEFEALFQQWRWQQLNLNDNPGGVEPVNTALEQPSITDKPQPAGITASFDEPSQMLSPGVAPVSDYHVVIEMLIEQLIATVKQHLADGWTPLGGISRASSASSASYWAQALVKRQVN